MTEFSYLKFNQEEDEICDNSMSDNFGCGVLYSHISSYIKAMNVTYTYGVTGYWLIKIVN